MMGETSLLPFPMLVDLGNEACCRCGYLLEGIGAPGVCPECGLGFDDGVSALKIHGVPKVVGGARWRKVVWVLIAVGAFVFVQGMILWIKYPLLALGWLGVIVGSSVAMAMTNTQRQTGTEVIVFSRFGIAHWPMKRKKKPRKRTKKSKELILDGDGEWIDDLEGVELISAHDGG
ncbi:MAG: hypothetical protein ACWA5W_08020 [Phycisphaerales bacterium]